MDTTTKMFYSAIQDDVFTTLLLVMLDVKNKQVTSLTIGKAKSVTGFFSELGESNTWLQMVAGTNPEGLDDLWMTRLKEELDSEFLETEELNKTNLEFDQFNKSNKQNTKPNLMYIPVYGENGEIYSKQLYPKGDSND